MAECANCPQAQRASDRRWAAPRREVPLSGILNIDKPQGMTSHDVVNAVRRMAGQRKVGHAGTLDPLATGVLLVCLGQATRVAEYLIASHKRYRATIVVGVETDTYDADGQITASGGRTDFSRAEIEAALARFVGRIEQVPPMYSALKRDGQPLYELARRGQTVERKPRRVEIESIDLLDWTSPSLIVELTCSPGTYVRSLAHDLGRTLGSGAYLDALVRLSSGRFTLQEAVSLSRLEEAFQHGHEDQYLLPPDEAFLNWPAMVLGAADASRILQGQAIPGDPPTSGHSAGQGSLAGPSLRRAYNLDGDFLAILTYHAASGLWRPKKVFAPG